MKKKQMSKGLILVAVGHANYLRMAENLANALKYNAGELQICLLTDGQTNRPELFSKVIPITKKDYKYSPLEIKSKLNKYTPFKHTLYLDVDMIPTMHKSIMELFESESEFMIQNLGEAKKSDWADVDEVKKVYKLDHLTSIFSECFIWKSGELADSVFKKWQEHYHKLKVEYKKFAGYVPDELPLMIALSELKIYPVRWVPIYWRGHGKEFLTLSMSLIHQKYYCYSIGGNANDVKMQTQYDLLSRHYANATGVKFPIYTYKPKKGWDYLRQSC